jgi:hypothetical protein
MPAALAPMHDEIHQLHSRVLSHVAAGKDSSEDPATLRAELKDCLTRAEKLATNHPGDGV